MSESDLNELYDYYSCQQTNFEGMITYQPDYNYLEDNQFTYSCRMPRIHEKYQPYRYKSTFYDTKYTDQQLQSNMGKKSDKKNNKSSSIISETAKKNKPKKMRKNRINKSYTSKLDNIEQLQINKQSMIEKIMKEQQLGVITKELSISLGLKTEVRVGKGKIRQQLQFIKQYLQNSKLPQRYIKQFIQLLGIKQLPNVLIN